MNASQLPVGARTVADQARIADTVNRLGAQIALDYAGEDLRLITVLKGGLLFLSDLCRAIPTHVQIDFLAVQPYSHDQSGLVRLTKDLSDDIEGASVILVEDVINTGLTANYVLSLLRARRPARLDVCTLLDKPSCRIADIPITYRGMEMSDEFLVGYGLDLAGRFRNLPFVASLPDSAVL